MSNGVRGPSVNSAHTPQTSQSQATGKGAETTPTTTTQSPARTTTGGFNAVNTFAPQTSIPVSTPSTTPTTTPTKTPTPTTSGSDDAKEASAKENHGKVRSSLAHSLNTLRKALEFANHKGNPNAAATSDSQIRSAITTIAKDLNLNLGDTSKLSGTDLLNLLATKMGIKTPTTGTTGSTSTSGSTSASGSTRTTPGSTSTATKPTGTGTMALFQQILQAALNDVKPSSSK